MSKTLTAPAAPSQPASHLALPVTLREEPPANAELRKIADDVLNSLKYAFAATAANPQAPAKGRADALFQGFQKARKPERRAAYQKTAQEFLRAPVAVRQTTFGRYGKIEPEQYLKVGSEGVATLVGKLQVDGKAVAAAVNRVVADDRGVAQAMAAVASNGKESASNGRAAASNGKKKKGSDKEEKDLAAGAKFEKLGLYLTKIQCVEETEGGGSDEIALGGTAIAPDGFTRKVGKLPTIGGFDTGETHNFNWLTDFVKPSDQLFAEFKLTGRDDEWPKTYTVIMAMAEEDWGGFSDFLSDMWEIVRDKVKAGIMAAASYFGPLGTLIGSIVSWLVDTFFGWIIDIAKDDMFKPKAIRLKLASSKASYYEAIGLTGKTPPPLALNFIGHGGHYRVWGYFKAQA
jgi:hypothetical protein